MPLILKPDRLRTSSVTSSSGSELHERLESTLTALAGLAAIFVACFFLLAPEWIDRASSQIVGDTGRAPSAEALALHQQLTVGDLHADSALWGWDLFTDSKWGQVDLPKLIAGRATMLMFTTVTKYTPWLEL